MANDNDNDNDVLPLSTIGVMIGAQTTGHEVVLYHPKVPEIPMYLNADHSVAPLENVLEVVFRLADLAENRPSLGAELRAAFAKAGSKP